MLKKLLIAVFAFPLAATAQKGSPFDTSALKATVSALSADSLRGRLTGSREAISAAHYIAQRWQQAGLKVFEEKDYLVPFSTLNSKDNYNVMAVLPGRSKPDEYIIFGAHYDHIGTITTEGRYGQHNNAEAGDTVYNGANDDASGVAALVALAEYFGAQKNNERSLLFIAFAGEEQGLNGSQAAARTIDADKVTAMLNFEMIGRPAEETGKRAYMTGAPYSDLFTIINNGALDYAHKEPLLAEDPFTEMQLFFRSDNASFAVKGVPAHTIAMTAPTDPYYHSLNDEANTLDYAAMSGLLTRLSRACDGLVKGKQTPTRVKRER